MRVLCDHALVEADAAFGKGSKAWTMHVINERWDVRMAKLALRCVGLHVPGMEVLGPTACEVSNEMIRICPRTVPDG